MEITHSFTLPITESSQAAEARRIGHQLTRQLQFSEEQAGKASLVIMEAATNLLKHAGGGELILQPAEKRGMACIEVLALDKGPGITNLQACMQDGYSTAGSQGTGLGAISRLATVFDIYSLPGQGTALLAEIHAEPVSGRSSPLDVELGAVCVPKPGEQECGDGWAVRCDDEALLLLVSDGLGHGPHAAQASAEARRVFHRQRRHPGDLLQSLHLALKSTRGAAVAVAELAFGGLSMTYAGVGNIAGVILSDGERGRHLVSHNGTVGHDARKIQEFSYEWPVGALLVMASDGIKTQWNLDAYPGLMRRHPSLIAGIIYRDFNRGRDDATVVVARRNAARRSA